MERKIVHIDMDAFYASVEQRDNPDYKGKPLIVGGSRERGVVAAASYEARKYGIHSAMPSKIAFNKCPSLIAVKPRMDVYKKVSMQIRSIFEEYTDLIEPLSLDEAFLDVTKVKKGPPSATLIANEIRSKIFNETKLTASAGVSVNKFLAKVASDVNKPNGIFVITPDKVIPFIENLKIEKFFGVGKVTAEKMHKMGIHNGFDLKQVPKYELQRKFGKAGSHFFNIVRGIDERPVEAGRERKSVGAEKTFYTDIQDKQELIKYLTGIAEKLYERKEKSSFMGRTLTLKVKYSDFNQITRSSSEGYVFESEDNIKATAIAILENIFPLEKPIRLLGLSISNSINEDRKDPLQLTIVDF